MNRVLHIQKVKGIAGSENHLLTLLPGLKEKGFDVEMLVLADQDDQPEMFIDKMAALGVKMHLVRLRLDLDPFAFLQLLKFLRDENFDLVHTHLLHGDLYGGMASKLSGIRHVLSSKHNDNAFRRKFPMKQLNRWIFGQFDMLICISEHMRVFARDVEDIPEDKLKVIYYGFEPFPSPGREIARQRLRLPTDVPVIGMVARLTAQKGHETLLHAMKGIVRSYPGARLVLIGGGELERELRDLADQLDIAENVEFAGYRASAANLMTAFDVFVHPSRWEGFGLVFLEAMNARLPVVATNVGAIPEIVVDGITGRLVPVDDPENLAAVIIELFGDENKRIEMGENGYRRMANEFKVATMIEKTVDLYSMLMEYPG